MKKTYCSSCRKKESVFIEGGLVIGNGGDEIYLVTDEKTIVCVCSDDISSIGMQIKISTLCDTYSVYHGSVTMEN